MVVILKPNKPPDPGQVNIIPTKIPVTGQSYSAIVESTVPPDPGQVNIIPTKIPVTGQSYSAILKPNKPPDPGQVNIIPTKIPVTGQSYSAIVKSKQPATTPGDLLSRNNFCRPPETENRQNRILDSASAPYEYYQTFHYVRPPTITPLVITVIPQSKDGLIVLRIGNGTADWYSGRLILDSEDHKCHFDDTIERKFNNGMGFHYFPEGWTRQEVFDLAKHLLTTAAATWYKAKTGHSGALFYQLPYVLGYHTSGEPSYVLVIAVKQSSPARPWLTISSIYPGWEQSQKK
jgi:hypothetical protein